MLALLRQFWRTLLAVSGWVGILYLYPDLRDLPDKYPILAQVAETERETLLIIFSAILVGYVALIDARPLIRRLFTRHQFVAGDIITHSAHFDGDGKTLWRNFYWLPIYNTRSDSRQIRNLRARLFAVLQWYPGTIGAERREHVDLNNGEQALVLIGEVMSREPFGWPQGPAEPTDPKSFVLNAERGHLFFSYGNSVCPIQMNGKSCEPDEYPFFVHILGEDVKSKMFRVQITCENFRPNLTVPNKFGEPLEPHTIIGQVAKARD